MDASASSPDAVTRNAEDIELAFKTLQFIGGIDRSVLSEVDVLSLLVNICNYQTRFATPMVLPFGMGTDMPDILATPRPMEVLLRFNAVCAVDDSDDSESHCMKHNGKSYCLVGSETWKRLTGEDSSDPALRQSSFLWIPDLLELLVTCKNMPGARSLAACWYYTASECTFEEDDDGRAAEGEPETLPASVEEFLGAQATVEEDTDVSYLHTDMQDYSSGSDEDFVPDGDDDGDEDYDGSDGDEDSDEPPGLEAIAGEGEEEEDDDEPPGLEAIAASDDDDEPPGLEAIEDGGDEEDEQDESLVETEFARLQRERVLKCVGELHAYLPSPTTDLSFFKRVLRKVSQGRADERWFPWGSPPIAHIVSVVSEQQVLEETDEEDEALVAFLREVLQLFADATSPST